MISLYDKKCYGHLDGNGKKPTDETGKKYSTWLKKENQAQNLLVQKLPDSILTKVLALGTVAKWWTVITHKFTVKSSHVVASMQTAFKRIKCTDNSNVCTHLHTLCTKYEELVCMDVTLTSK